MPFGRLFGTLGGHIQSRSVVLFGISFGTVSVAVFAFIWNLVWNASVAILHSFGMDWAHLTYHLSPVHLQDVRRMQGELIVSDRGARGALAGSPPGVLVDSSVGVLAIT